MYRAEGPRILRAPECMSSSIPSALILHARRMTVMTVMTKRPEITDLCASNDTHRASHDSLSASENMGKVELKSNQWVIPNRGTADSFAGSQSSIEVLVSHCNISHSCDEPSDPACAR